MNRGSSDGMLLGHVHKFLEFSKVIKGTSAAIHASILNAERLSVSDRNVNVVREMALQSPLLSFRGNRRVSLAGGRQPLHSSFQ